MAKQTERVDRLQTKLRGELDGLRASLRDLETGEEYQIPANLEAQTTDWMRGTRHLKNKAEDYREQLVQGAPRPPPMLSVPEVIKQEQEILALKERVMDLEGQVRAYQGLPPERDLARLEVERVQGELAELEGRREGMYDGMIGNSRQ